MGAVWDPSSFILPLPFRVSGAEHFLEPSPKQLPSRFPGSSVAIERIVPTQGIPAGRADQPPAPRGFKLDAVTEAHPLAAVVAGLGLRASTQLFLRERLDIGFA